jgi:hypothetical protein
MLHSLGTVTMPEFRVVCYEAGASDQANARVVEAEVQKRLRSAYAVDP